MLFIENLYPKNNKEIFGKIINKSWRIRTQNNVTTRDVLILDYKSRKEIWYRLPEDLSEKMIIGETCIVYKDKISCFKSLSPMSLSPYIENLFVQKTAKD